MLFDFLGLYPYYGHKILTCLGVGVHGIGPHAQALGGLQLVSAFPRMFMVRLQVIQLQLYMSAKQSVKIYPKIPIMENQMEIELNAARACSELGGH